MGRADRALVLGQMADGFSIWWPDLPLRRHDQPVALAFPGQNPPANLAPMEDVGRRLVGCLGLVAIEWATGAGTNLVGSLWHGYTGQDVRRHENVLACDLGRAPKGVIRSKFEDAWRQGAPTSGFGLETALRRLPTRKGGVVLMPESHGFVCDALVNHVGAVEGERSLLLHEGVSARHGGPWVALERGSDVRYLQGIILFPRKCSQWRDLTHAPFFSQLPQALGDQIRAAATKRPGFELAQSVLAYVHTKIAGQLKGASEAEIRDLGLDRIIEDTLAQNFATLRHAEKGLGNLRDRFMSRRARKAVRQWATRNGRRPRRVFVAGGATHDLARIGEAAGGVVLEMQSCERPARWDRTG